MRQSIFSFVLLGAANVVKGDLHHLLVGTFGTNSIYTLEFDDKALTLNLIGNHTTQVSSSWIALSHDNKALYGNIWGTPNNSFVSYPLRNATDLGPSVIVNGNEECESSSIFVTAATEPPYAVYGAPYVIDGGHGNTSCGTVMSVEKSGVFSGVSQEFNYAPKSAVHGMGLNKKNTFLYSADDKGQSLWTHSIDPDSGKVTFVDSQPGPSEKSGPRHVTVHPEGKYLYLLLEGADAVAQYTIDQRTGIPLYENVTYSMSLPNTSTTVRYADEVALSSSNKYLWASSRGRPSPKKGTISAFSLNRDGAIKEQLFLINTTSGGGLANAIAPSPFSDKWVAITDEEFGYVEIWALADDATTAKVVARIDLADGSCCANAVWYS